MEINVAELVTLHSIIVFVNLCRHGKASNTEIYIFKALLINIVEDIRKHLI